MKLTNEEVYFAFTRWFKSLDNCEQELAPRIRRQRVPTCLGTLSSPNDADIFVVASCLVHPMMSDKGSRDNNV